MALPSLAVKPAAALTRIFGPYLLTECIGRGGTAVIYKGKRRGLGGFEKQVVIKTLLPELLGKPRYVRLFNAEARLSAQLFHANVVQVQNFGVIGGAPYLELEYLSGWNLKQLWDKVGAGGQRIPVAIALTLATEACRGLAYAHAFVDDAGVHRPIIHRDISPANVMICRDGTVKLLDFGLASLTRGETLAIETFQGKLGYMSPEQLERKQVDRRADVFAFGVLLHELLTGARLFKGENDVATLQRLMTLAVDPPSRHNREVPAALDTVVLRALARNPNDRPQSAGELLAALEGLGDLAASRKQLMGYLGATVPEVFTTSCDGCGRQLPCGTECPDCRTQIDDTHIPPIEEPRAHLSIVRTPPEGVLLPAPPSRMFRLRRQLILLQVTLWLLFRRWNQTARALARRGSAIARKWKARR